MSSEWGHITRDGKGATSVVQMRLPDGSYVTSDPMKYSSAKKHLAVHAQNMANEVEANRAAQMQHAIDAMHASMAAMMDEHRRRQQEVERIMGERSHIDSLFGDRTTLMGTIPALATAEYQAKKALEDAISRAKRMEAGQLAGISSGTYDTTRYQTAYDEALAALTGARTQADALKNQILSRARGIGDDGLWAPRFESEVEFDPAAEAERAAALAREQANKANAATAGTEGFIDTVLSTGMRPAAPRSDDDKIKVRATNSVF